MQTRISVVIPTYNRPAQLSRVLDHMLGSDTANFDEIEIIIVDDGSPESAQLIVDSKQVNDPFRLRYLFQNNSGPAKARNCGISHATHDLVILIDDDVLVLSDTLQRHVQVHLDKPGSIVHGPYPYVPQERETPAFRYLNSLIDHRNSAKVDERTGNYSKVSVVASGNISFEKSMFSDGKVYRSDLLTPAAEEFELEHRLNRLRVPIYMAANVRAWHLQPPTIEDKCKQEFKYGVGAAEVWVKVPEISENEHISSFVLENGYIDWKSDPAGRKMKKIVKSILAGKTVRKLALLAANILERVVPSDKLLFPIYRFLCGINLFAGVRDGLKTFGRR